MPLYDCIGPWLYWPIVAVFVSGSISWTINCISVTYSEVAKQIEELTRVAKQ